jgi:fluoroacetyl-CoA thioesterase
MKTTLQAGVSRTERVTVDRERTIGFLGEDLRVYSTPSMVGDVEYISKRMLDEHLDTGESSVGMHVALDHLGATPLDQTVEVTVKIASVDGRKVEIEAEVRDALDVVGRGRHVRFVIDVAKQAERVAKKKAALAAKTAG